MVQIATDFPGYLQEQIFGASNTASVTDPSDSDFESAQWTAYNQLATEGFPGDSDLDWGFVVSCWLASSRMTQHRWWCGLYHNQLLLWANRRVVCSHGLRYLS